MYTSEGQFWLFGSRTLNTLKKGLFMEGICMMDSNEELQLIAMLNMKCSVMVYKVKNLE